MTGHRVFQTSFASIHEAYRAKVERKGRSRAELDAVVCWLTGHDGASLQAAIDDRRTLQDFFATVPAMNPAADLVTGVVCGVRVEQVEDPLMRDIRRMDKLVDELAKGKPMAKVLRVSASGG